MTPLAITILTLVARYGPGLVQQIVAVANKPDPTQADWTKLFKDIEDMDYDRGIREAQARLDAEKGKAA